MKTASLMLRVLVGLGSVFLGWPAMAKDQPPQIVLWPDSGPTVVRFSFGKLKEIASIGNRRSYLIDTTAENLWQNYSDGEFFALSVRQE